MTENHPKKQTNNLPEDSTGEIDALLADLWQRHLPTLRERLNLLDRTAIEAATGTLNETARAEGQSVAHKLSGNLGMFGHQNAGDIASQIEHILKAPTPETLLQLAGLTRNLHEILAASL
jgi:HPt (histidine-containing phosphotransfer) domain-containing protein